jgi:hypothetical protein
MKVSLGKVWRQFAVPPRATLDHLVTAIDDAFRFDSDHLYSVQVEQPNGSSVEYSHPFSELSPHASETRLERLPLHPGSKMTLVYDSGGQWTFGIVVERIDPPQPALKKPKLLAEFGKPPPQYGEEYEEDLEDEADQEEDGKDHDEPDEQESGE